MNVQANKHSHGGTQALFPLLPLVSPLLVPLSLRFWGGPNEYFPLSGSVKQTRAWISFQFACFLGGENVICMKRLWDRRSHAVFWHLHCLLSSHQILSCPLIICSKVANPDGRDAAPGRNLSATQTELLTTLHITWWNKCLRFKKRESKVQWKEKEKSWFYLQHLNIQRLDSIILLFGTKWNVSVTPRTNFTLFYVTISDLNLNFVHNTLNLKYLTWLFRFIEVWNWKTWNVSVPWKWEVWLHSILFDLWKFTLQLCQP